MPIAEPQNQRVTRFIHFTPEDYKASAQACRVAAAQAENDAAKQGNPGIVKMFNDTAKRFRDLAQKHELAAKVL